MPNYYVHGRMKNATSYLYTRIDGQKDKKAAEKEFKKAHPNYEFVKAYGMDEDVPFTDEKYSKRLEASKPKRNRSL